MSWISIDDVIHAIEFIIRNKQIYGAVNIVSPEPVTNYHYSKALGKAISRPVIFKIPAFILKLVLGEMADALLLSSSKVIPQKLTDHRYKFLHSTIEQAFEAIFAQKI
jgi:NAD dependent epimerase/dehydratase family enzyme